MKKLVKISVYFILAMIVLTLTEANSKMLYDTSIFFLKDKTLETWIALLKAIGFSLATIVIVIENKNLVIKLFFIVMDGFIVFVAYYIEPQNWIHYSGIIYGLYTSLIFYFIGSLAHKFYFEKTEPKKDFEKCYIEANIAYDKAMSINDNYSKKVDELKDRIDKYKEANISLINNIEIKDKEKEHLQNKLDVLLIEQTILHLKRSSKEGKRWDQIPETINKISELESKKDKLNNKIKNYVENEGNRN